MDDLRNEIRVAFEKEQAVFPPAGNLRPKLERPARNFQWLAVAAAVVLTALVVFGLVSSRLTNRGTVSPPKATPSPVGDYGPPPAGVPLVYVGDPNHPGWYIGFDWNGVPRGTIKLAQPVVDQGSLQQSPDASAFVISSNNGKGGGWQYVDRLGNPTNDVNPASIGPDFAWADDNTGLCALNYLGQHWTLALVTPGQVAPSGQSIAIDPAIVRSGIIGVQVVACSPKNDRAVLVRNYFGVPAQAWVVRISDGAILRHESVAANSYSDIQGSRDGSLLAENSSKSTGYLAGPTAPHTIIRRASDGTMVATLDPSYGVLAFTADDKFALVATSPFASGVPTHLAVVDIATGAVVWRYDGNEELSGFVVEPSGGAFAVMLQQPSDQSPHPTVSLLMVFAYGRQAVGIPGTFVRP